MPFSTASLVHSLQSFFPGVYQMNQNQAMTCRFHQSLQSSGFLALVQIDEILAEKTVWTAFKKVWGRCFIMSTSNVFNDLF